jgi:hypothetical protein
VCPTPPPRPRPCVPAVRSRWLRLTQLNLWDFCAAGSLGDGDASVVCHDRQSACAVCWARTRCTSRSWGTRRGCPTSWRCCCSTTRHAKPSCCLWCVVQLALSPPIQTRRLTLPVLDHVQNLLDKSLLFTMFQMDFGKLDAYWSLYEELLKRNLPKLWQHFTDMGVTPHQYLMDWFFTVFSRTVPLELSSMLWDHFGACCSPPWARLVGSLGVLAGAENSGFESSSLTSRG